MDCYFSSQFFKKSQTKLHFCICITKNLASFKTFLMPLFQNFLQKEKFFDIQKIAKILPLKIPNKKDKLLFEIYCPIFLLLILSKIIEYLILQKISHLYKAYNQFFRHYCNGSKFKNTFETFVIFQKKFIIFRKIKKQLILLYLIFKVYLIEQLKIYLSNNYKKI